MSTIIALDPATHCGCAIGAAGSEPRLSSVTMRDSKDDTHEDVYGRATRWFNQVVQRHQPVLVAIEKPFYATGNSNFSTTVVLQGLYAVFTGVARAQNITVWPVTVGSWRKHTLGKAKLGSRDEAKKAMVKLCKTLSWPAPDDNAADAAGIWIWASAKFAPHKAIAIEPLFLPRSQEEADAW
jgi:Holliday junction resolvasome RuvABC endonuclease subunit